jgi:hypothetical protein
MHEMENLKFFLIYPADKSTMILRNVGEFNPSDTAERTKRYESSAKHVNGDS